jgi:hypothetical protein
MHYHFVCAILQIFAISGSFPPQRTNTPATAGFGTRSRLSSRLSRVGRVSTGVCPLAERFVLIVRRPRPQWRPTEPKWAGSDGAGRNAGGA